MFACNGGEKSGWALQQVAWGGAGVTAPGDAEQSRQRGTQGRGLAGMGDRLTVRLDDLSDLFQT